MKVYVLRSSRQWSLTRDTNHRLIKHISNRRRIAKKAIEVLNTFMCCVGTCVRYKISVIKQSKLANISSKFVRQSYKCSTIVIYDARVAMIIKLESLRTYGCSQLDKINTLSYTANGRVTCRVAANVNIGLKSQRLGFGFSCDYHIGWWWTIRMENDE